MSNCTAWNGRFLVNNEPERMRTETAVAQFKTLAQHLPGGTDKNHENPLSV
jgi:hypothetical protein